MARRQKLWAARERARMVLALGSHCMGCGTEEHLTFDCIEPMGPAHHAWNAPERVSFYRAQMKKGNVQLLCVECNALKAGMTSYDWETVLCMVASKEALLRHAQYPGRGTGLEPASCREFIRGAIKRLTQTL
jgi:hypothetical protein